MDEEKIGLVLARASELRLKVSSCIQKASTFNAQGDEPNTKNQEFEETAETLFDIRDALQALETQLSSLQALQQQQWYEKEAALAEIECSQKKLLKNLEEYEGKDLEVIHEAIAFVGETVDDNNDLLLPPYPSRPSPGLGSDSGYKSHFTSSHNYPRNGLISNGQREEFSEGLSTDKNQMAPQSRSPFRGIQMLLGAAAKVTFTVVGVICILSLAGFEPTIRKRNENQLNIWGLLPQLEENSEKKGTIIECPAGRIPVIEDGEVRCLVKERVEVPFGSVVATPNVNYGCG